MKKIFMFLLIMLCIIGCSSNEKETNIENNGNEEVEKNICSSKITKHKITLGGDANTSIQIENAVHEETLENNIIIELNYPVISGLDNSIDLSINEIIRSNALSVYSNEKIIETEGISFALNYSWYASEDVLSIEYEGTAFAKGMAHPTHFISTLNINLKTGEKLRFSDLYNIEDDTIHCLYDNKKVIFFETEETIKEYYSKDYDYDFFSIIQSIDTEEYMSDTIGDKLYSYYDEDTLTIIVYDGMGTHGYKKIIISYEEIEKLRLD